MLLHTSPAYQKAKAQLHPPVGRLCPTIRKPALSSRLALPTRGQTPDRRKPQSGSLGPRLHSRLHPNLGPAGHWPCPLADQYKLCDDYDLIPNYARNRPSPPQRSNMCSGPQSPMARLQDLTLSASSLALTLGPCFTCTWWKKTAPESSES